MRKYWERWKDTLATWATIVILVSIIASIFGVKPIDLDSLYQVKFYFLLAVIVPIASAHFSLIRTSNWTKRHRNILIIVLFSLALIFGIIWLILAKTLRQPHVLLWAFYSLIPLSLLTSATNMLTYKQPQQPEEPLSNVKDREEALIIPKPVRRKIISLAVLRDITRALNDCIFGWWKMWKNILALLATISAIAYTLADLVFHIDTARIGEFMVKYSEIALILFASLFIITLIIYGIIIARRNKSSSCKTK